MTRDADPLSEIPTCAHCREMGLPVSDTLARLETELGHDTLRAFLAAKGGRLVVIPVRAVANADSDPIAAALDWLRRDVGYGRWEVPLGPMARRARLSWAILTRLRAGRSLATIAGELGCALRTVTNHKTRFTRRGVLPAPASTSRNTGQ
ncbi:MAG: hypothetical protein KDA73_01365 [Rhodobacteraceae bacterium]|nr:hypothetical protein [Paracoccaceae bacterium]